MFQPYRAIFRELCTVKSNLKTNAVFIKYYGQCRLVNFLFYILFLFIYIINKYIFTYRICFKIRFYCT
jgi:hypothetical protein